MNESCRAFDALIARRAQLTTGEAARLETHLAGCASCRELAAAFKPEVSALAATSASETVRDTQMPAGSLADLDLPESTRYRITGEVGRGGIGRVMQALDQVLDRPVALKELFSTNAGMRRRFMREALITARLQHPSIVPIYDAGHLHDRSPFYAMKLVAGHPLDKSIAEATTLEQRLALVPTVLAIADAIAYAHSQHIIHRDLKPTNVLVGKYGETIVIDWGLAKDLAWDDPEALDAGPYRAAATADQTVEGTVLGTPAYMAPEQAAGEAVDERADVYALGTILYHVISGVAPHEGKTFEEMLERVISGDVRPLTEREPGVPRDLAAIVNKAMALEPSHRYPNAQGLADDLRRFLTGQLVASHSYGARELLRRWVVRHRAAVGVAAAAILVVGIVASIAVLRIVRARQEADESAAAAIEEKNIASEALADLLAEQGRQELLAGRPARAAVFLVQAQARRRDSDAGLRTLLAGAMHSIDAQRFLLDGHIGEVHAAAYSPDGKRILTASEDGTATLWDATTGTAVATLRGHVSAIEAASFSLDNAHIVTAGRDEAARLWDAGTGKLVATLRHRLDHLRSVAFSPDGTRIVTIGSSGAARVWDVRTADVVVSFGQDLESGATFSPDGTRVLTVGGHVPPTVWNATTGAALLSLDGHRAHVRSAAFSPDGSQIVTASDDGTARLWDAQSGTPIISLAGHTGPVTWAAFSRDGSRVVTASADSTAKVWDARTGTLATSLAGHSAAVHSAAFSRDGAHIVTASSDRSAKVWETDTGRLVETFDLHRDDLTSASFSPDGTRILTASVDGTAAVWDIVPTRFRVALAAGPGTIAKGKLSKLSRDGAILLTNARLDLAPKLWDTRSGKLLASLEGHFGEVTSVVFDSLGTHVVTASDDHTAKLWDAKTGTLARTFRHGDAVRGVAFSADDQRIVTASADKTARVWNAQTGEMIAKFEGAAGLTRVALSADGRRVVTIDANFKASVWSADTGVVIAEVPSVFAAVLSADGERVVTAGIVPGGPAKVANVWEVRTGKLLATLDGHTGFVLGARFSPDGTRVVTASADRTAKIWDASSGKLLASLDGHTHEVVAAAFSPVPGDTRVLTASVDGTANLWDARTGKVIASFEGRPEGLIDVAFSPDGTRIVTATRDGSIWIGDVHLEQRDRETIEKLVTSRDPWTLSNGTLVPVPGKHTDPRDRLE